MNNRSNLQKAMDNGLIYCTINSKVNNLWRDFTLQKGHIYGYSPELKRDGLSGLFVVYQVQRDYIILRVARKNLNGYKWENRTITHGCDTGRIVADVNRNRIGGVQLQKYDISSFYKPRLTTDPYMPMPHMRIPMGNRGINKIVSESHYDNLSATTSKEFMQKRRDRKYQNVINTLEVAAHRVERNMNK